MGKTTLARQRTLHQPSQSTKQPRLVLPLIGTGILMAAYLMIRPYGDSASLAPEVRAAAFASPRWVIAHLAGAFALVSFARFALRLSDANPDSTAAGLARWSGLAGAVLVLPYYGAETFALHVIGQQALADVALLDLTDQIRNLPVGLTTFGVGLLLLAISGVAAATAWRRIAGSLAAWPRGLGVALLLPQFYLPSVGRMAFGLAYLATAGLLAASAEREGVARGLR